ncbi:MAG: hypothetical protein JXA79_04330 [Deltaproteobacteria bacterium]|nr:hypothetical protein [Deltaproteobacteria bacterium]
MALYLCDIFGYEKASSKYPQTWLDPECRIAGDLDFSPQWRSKGLFIHGVAKCSEQTHDLVWSEKKRF